MTPQSVPPATAAPSGRTLARATLFALLIALVLLFTAILPAEYGIDPLRTGAALNLLGLAGANQSSGAAPGAVKAGVFTPRPGIYKMESEDFLLGPGDGVEMKYHMEKGASMVYGWKGDGKLIFEFHGEPDKKPRPDYFESYQKDDKVGRDSSYGSFIAPSTGIHGWFWQNKSKKEVRFHLTVSGFFESATMFVDGSPQDMPLFDANKMQQPEPEPEPAKPGSAKPGKAQP